LAATGVLAVLYVAASALNLPLGIAAIVGAVLLVTADGLAGGWRQSSALVEEVPWTLFPLLAGLLLLVSAAEQVGLLAPLVRVTARAPEVGTVALPLLTLGMALLANLLNNLPAALVAGTALGGLPAGIERSDLVAAAIVGLNLGPNLTTIGSLATMLWL